MSPSTAAVVMLFTDVLLFTASRLVSITSFYALLSHVGRLLTDSARFYAVYFIIFNVRVRCIMSV